MTKRYEEIVKTNKNKKEIVVGWSVDYFTLNTDIRGSITNIIKPNGSQSIGYVYDEFGNQITTGEERFINNASYSGAIYYLETELIYMNFRRYDFSPGRFISQDAYRGNISSPQTQHLYSYTYNNPINFVVLQGISRCQ